MQHSTQVDLARRLFAHIDAGTTDMAPDVAYNDVEVFTSSDRLAREWETLFLDRPQYLGLSCQIRESGDYFTNDDLGVPILVTRDHAGTPRAFLNVCRHRGARVMDGCGRRKRAFVCPYHAWSYDTSGRLVGLPERKSFGEVDTASLGLRELPCAERHGMIWVSARPENAVDPDQVLGGLDEELASYGFAGYHHYDTRVLNWKMNWKIALDTFLEPYHFPALHRETVAPIFLPNLCLVDTFGCNLREVLARRSIQAMREEPECDWNLVRESALVYVLVPNVVVIVQIDHLEIFRIYPVTGKVDESRVYFEFYIPEPATTEKAVEHWRRNLDLTVRTIEEEDFPTGEGIQAGLGSGANRQIVYGRNEPALQHFERTITEMVETAAA